MSQSSFLSRFRQTLSRLWQDAEVSVKGSETLTFAPDLPDADLERLARQLQTCLDEVGGEVSARARAVALGQEYLSLSDLGRKRFLLLLTTRFASDPVQIERAVEDWRAAAPEGRSKAERDLRKALDAPRRTLLTQFNALPEGIKFLVDMRAELLKLAKTEPILADLAADLKYLLGNWFDVGFLELHRITWRSPASILEKIMAYEAVHAVRGWEDLKNRLDSDRRLYAFFHPRMPDEPLIFVQVALVNGLADNVDDLLDLTAPLGNPDQADTAIFYSISAAQKGLAGISLGNFLIKRVVAELSRELGHIRTFATLSPIPGFRRWLEAQPELEDLNKLLDQGDWLANPDQGNAIRPILLTQAARYLMTERRPDNGLRAKDDVANFHLTNGARIERINWLANKSERGLKESHGLMVNYLYRPDLIESNHEAYVTSGKVAASSSLRGLLA